MAAAEGCDEKVWLADAPGRPSLRIGDVFREDFGLDVAEGDDELGSREADCCLRSVGLCMEDEEDTEFWRVALVLRRWTVAVEDADDISEPSEGGADGRCSGWSAWPFMAARVSVGFVGMV